MRPLLLALIAFLLLIFILTFVSKNPQQVTLDYYFGFNFKGSVALLIFISFAVGVSVGYLTLCWRVLRLRHKLNKAYSDVRQGNDKKALDKMPDIPRT